VRALIASLLLCAGCGVELEHGLDERQANQVAALLEGAGLSADKLADDSSTGGGGYKIVVARGEVARAFALLESRDLPRRGQKGLAETFSDSSLMPSPVEERARYAAALGAELERTLESMPGVIAARVHLALAADDPLSAAPRTRPTASVLIKSRASGGAPASEADVRRLIAGAVPTLAADDVSVVFAAAPPDETPPPLDHFGPIRVAHGSRSTATALASASLALILLLSIALIWTTLRHSNLKRRLRDLEKPLTS
jgi:type III secretion protein J